MVVIFVRFNSFLHKKILRIFCRNQTTAAACVASPRVRDVQLENALPAEKMPGPRILPVVGTYYKFWKGSKFLLNLLVFAWSKNIVRRLGFHIARMGGNAESLSFIGGGNFISRLGKSPSWKWTQKSSAKAQFKQLHVKNLLFESGCGHISNFSLILIMFAQ